MLNHNDNVRSVSQDPGNYKDAPTEGIRRVLEIVGGEKVPRSTILKTDKIGLIFPILDVRVAVNHLPVEKIISDYLRQ
jgi:5-oxoprolinase (ATP-hydrolysing)